MRNSQRKKGFFGKIYEIKINCVQPIDKDANRLYFIIHKD